MAEPPRYRETTGGTDDGTGVGPDRESSTGIPRWVRMLGIVVAVLVLLIVALMLTGVLGGVHGPARHVSSGGAVGDTPPPSATLSSNPA